MPLYGIDEAKNFIELEPKPNLLINADFKSGIINQKGLTHYIVNNPYQTWIDVSIDKWLVANETELDVLSGKIKITGKKESSVFLQKFEQLGAGTYTIYVNVEEITGSPTVYIENLYNGEGDWNSIHQLKQGINEFTIEVPEGFNSFGFQLKGESVSATISEIKLEKGNVFSGMPLWIEKEELTKCKKFMQIINLGKSEHSAVGYGVSSYDCYINIPLSIEMDKNPSVIGLVGSTLKTTTTKGQISTSVKSLIASAKTLNGITIAFSVNDITNLGTYSPIIAEFTTNTDVILDSNDY